MKTRFTALTRVAITTMFALASLLFGSSQTAQAYSIYDCYGAYAQATVCIDPTTGFGPLVYVFDANGTAIYITGVEAACTKGNYYMTPKTVDHGSYVNFGYGNTSPGYVASIGVFPHYYTGCAAINSMGQADVTQTQMDYIRWYANSVNAQALITVY
jgi:hypothetical protein